MHVSVPCRRKRPRKEKPGQGTGLGGTQENAQYKIKPVRETGLDNSRCHAGKPFCSGVFEYAGTRGLSCIDVLLSAGSANKTKGDRHMGR